MTRIISHPDWFFVENQRAAYGFELVTDSVALLLVGAVLTLFAGYVLFFWKRDRLITRAFVLVVVLLCLSEAIVEVWTAWWISITAFENSHLAEGNVAQNVQFFLVPGVVALVQLFWLGTIYRSMNHTSKIRWLLLIISLVVVLAFALQLVSAVVGIHINPPKLSTSWKFCNGLNYAWLALVLAIDLFVVLALLLRLIAIRRRSPESLKSSISLLAWIFLSFSILSTASVLATMLLILSQVREAEEGYHNGIVHIRNFQPVVSPIYALSVLSMLLARAKFWKQQGGTTEQGVPEMRLVEDSPSSEEADETAPSTQVDTSIQELPMGQTNSTTSSDDNEKFHRHTIHSDGRIQRKQQDFGTLTEP